MDFDEDAQRHEYVPMSWDDLEQAIFEKGEELDTLLVKNGLEGKGYQFVFYSDDRKYWNRTRLIERLLSIDREIAELRAKEPPPPPPIPPEEYESKIEELKQQLEEKAATINNLETQLNESKAALETATREHATALAAAQADAQQANAALAAAQADAQQAKNNAETEIAALRQQLTEAQNRPAQIDTSATDRLTAEITELRNKLSSCVETQRETIKCNEQLRQQLTTISAERDRLATELSSAPKPLPPAPAPKPPTPAPAPKAPTPEPTPAPKQEPEFKLPDFFFS